MTEYGILSILPPILAIVLAIKTKQVYISLGAGIFIGYLIIAQWNPLFAIHDSFTALIEVFKDSGNVQTIIFCLLMGSLITFSKKSGGIAGFVSYIEKTVDEKLKSGKKKSRSIQYLAAVTGVVIFIETSISALTVGTLFKPLFEKYKISKAKLAYIVDSSSAPTSALIPFNAWGAFIMGLLVSQGVDAPFKTLLGALTLNFYPIVTIIMLFIVITFSLNIGLMSKREDKAKLAKYVAPSTASVPNLAYSSASKNRSSNFIIPLVVLVITMPLFLATTGYLNIKDTNELINIWTLIGNGNGSLSVLYAVSSALLVSGIMLKIQKIIPVKKQIDLIFSGMGDLLPLASLMVLAFMISNMCKDLGTGVYIAQIAKSSIPIKFIPAIIFLLSGFIAFSTGTSWGTFAIMISIAIPISNSLGIDASLLTAAVIGGGVFGDHCSPISDTTIISSMASSCDHIIHVRTQLPYALIAGGISLLGFLFMGFLQ